MCRDPSRLLWRSQQWSTRSHWNLRPWGYRRTAMLYGLGQTGGSRFQRSYLRYRSRNAGKRKKNAYYAVRTTELDADFPYA